MPIPATPAANVDSRNTRRVQIHLLSELLPHAFELRNDGETRYSVCAMRSDTIKRGAERAPHRSLLRATGSIESEDDFNKPFIAIANSYTDCIPGHAHLNEVGQLIKRLVREAGGVPFIFNTIGVDDGIAMGHGGNEILSPVPRTHRRLRRDHDPRALFRRHGLHPELRQDRARAC